MPRSLLSMLLVILSALPASAQVLGDFDCVSDLSGPDTPAGTLRIEEPTRFTFLTEDFLPGDLHPMEISAKAVIFNDAFADHISAGATMIDAQVLEDEFTYTARILTTDSVEVFVVCPYIF